MAKFMFIICILVALVNEKRAQSSAEAPPSAPFNYENCVEARVNHHELRKYSESGRVSYAKVICIMEGLHVKGTRPLDSNKLDKVFSRAFEKGSNDDIEIERVEKGCATGASPIKGSSRSDIKQYVDWIKCMQSTFFLKENMDTTNIP